MRNLASRAIASCGRGLAAISLIVGVREAMLLSGLGLVGYGAGIVYWPAGFFLPGAVLLFCAISGLAR